MARLFCVGDYVQISQPSGNYEYHGCHGWVDTFCDADRMAWIELDVRDGVVGYVHINYDALRAL